MIPLSATGLLKPFKADTLGGRRGVMHFGWPAMAALFLLVCAAVSLGAAWWIHNESSKIVDQLGTAQKRQTSGSGEAAPVVSSSLGMAPDDTEYLRDLGRIFKIAKEGGINIGAIEYKVETAAIAPLLIRSVTLRVTEAYPKIKGFISLVLYTLPNAALQEVRIQRQDPAALEGAVLLKFSLIYKNTDGRQEIDSQGTQGRLSVNGGS